MSGVNPVSQLKAYETAGFPRLRIEQDTLCGPARLSGPTFYETGHLDADFVLLRTTKSTTTVGDEQCQGGSSQT